MKDFYNFKNGQEMLDKIKEGVDLYCKEIGVYVFLYNDYGSICCYYIDEDEAEKLRKDQKTYGDYWGAFLGWGGEIFDDPDYPDYDEERVNNIEKCNELYECLWEDVTYPDTEQNDSLKEAM